MACTSNSHAARLPQHALAQHPSCLPLGDGGRPLSIPLWKKRSLDAAQCPACALLAYLASFSRPPCLLLARELCIIPSSPLSAARAFWREATPQGCQLAPTTRHRISRS